MKMKSKILIGIILLIIIPLSGRLIYKQLTSNPEKITTNINATKAPTGKEIQEINLTEEQLKQYYSVYENPFVLHIRKVLNSYIHGDIEGFSSPNVAVKANIDKDGLITGLDSFSKDYYKSKFVVVSITDFLGGGKEIEIQFQDKPDKIFGTWVYKLADSSYDLRGFWQHPISQEKLSELSRKHKMFLEDKEHAL